MNTDPYEQKNLFDEAKLKDRIRDLALRICEWQERTGDKTTL